MSQYLVFTRIKWIANHQIKAVHFKVTFWNFIHALTVNFIGATTGLVELASLGGATTGAPTATVLPI